MVAYSIAESFCKTKYGVEGKSPRLSFITDNETGLYSHMSEGFHVQATRVLASGESTHPVSDRVIRGEIAEYLYEQRVGIAKYDMHDIELIMLCLQQQVRVKKGTSGNNDE